MKGRQDQRGDVTVLFRLGAIGLLLAMATLKAAVAPAQAAMANLENSGQRLDLQGVPSLLASIGGERFVLGFARDGATDLLLIDRGADPASEAARLQLDFPIADGEVDYSGKRLVAIGNKDGNTWIASVDLASAGKIVERILPVTLANPLVAVDAAGVAWVADAGLGRIYILNQNSFDDAQSQASVANTLFFDSPGGVGSMHVTADGQFGFVSDHASPRLSIVDASGRVLDTLSGPTASNSVRFVGPATVSFHDGSQGVSAPASLLMADYASETLRIVDFEPVLQALSVTTATSIALPIRPGAVLEPDPVGAVSRSPVLLGASADEGIIAVGNLFSTTVLFFSRTGSVLERIGSAMLARPPGRILVSKTGRNIMVSYADAPFVTIIGLKNSEASAQGNAQLDPGGSPEVREIQKLLGELGYPIGAVDGYAGPRTMQSLEAVRDKTGRRIDLAEPAAAVEVLRSLRKSN